MKIGIRNVSVTNNVEDIKKSLEIIAKTGFEVLDYSLLNESVLSLPYNEFIAYFTDMARYIQSLGLKTEQSHIIYFPYKRHVEDYDALIEIQKRAIIATNILGGEYAVMHPLIPDQREYDKYIDKTFEINMKYFESFRSLLKEYDMNICIENLYKGSAFTKIIPSCCSTADELGMYLDNLGDRYYACLDTGHVNLVRTRGYASNDFSHYAKLLKGKIKSLHVHDNDGITDYHYAPFLGNIDWDDFLLNLEKAEYSGSLCLECVNHVDKTRPEYIHEGYKMVYMAGKRLIDMYNKKGEELK